MTFLLPAVAMVYVFCMFQWHHDFDWKKASDIKFVNATLMVQHIGISVISTWNDDEVVMARQSCT